MKTKTGIELSPMHKHFNELTVQTLTREQMGGNPTVMGRVHAMTWLFKKDSFPCGACHLSDNVQFMVLPTGVYRSCKYDGFTEKIDPINYENGQEATLLEDVICATDEEAMEIVLRYNQQSIYCDPDSSLNLPEYKLPKRPRRTKKVVPE